MEGSGTSLETIVNRIQAPIQGNKNTYEDNSVAGANMDEGAGRKELEAHWVRVCDRLRKEIGDKQLFGILGRGKSQIAYAKVSLNVVNVATSEVVFSAQGAGEYSLDSREVIGFGGTSSYDSTLNGKVLDLAMREAVNNLVNGIQSGAWQPGQ